MSEQSGNDVRASMDAAAEEAGKAFAKLMKDPEATALDLVKFHQAWYQRAGHKRLGAMYRDFPTE